MLIVGLIVTLVTTVILGAVALVGNNYRFDQRTVTIPGPEGSLAGVLTLPQGGKPRGLVVMVHGDGPMDATQGGLYSPWFEGAADADYATLSWSKPGVGGSSGDWLSQTMTDRAKEVSAVIDWAKTQSDIPTSTIVLWGASQAGWVLPKVTRDRRDIAAVVTVGPAINWLRQGRFNLQAELAHDGATPTQRQRAIAESDDTRRLLERDAPYREYLASAIGSDPMSQARWGFVRKNFRSDATADLRASAARPIPVHLMVGTHDRNVDVAETERTYRSILGSSLSVTHLDGAHSLARPVMEDNGLVGLVTGTLWPRALLAPGTIDDYRAFLSRVPSST